MHHFLRLKLVGWAGLALLCSANALEAQRRRGWPEDAPVKRGVMLAEGQHFVMHLQFKNQLAADRALAAVDAAWSETMNFLGTPDYVHPSLLEIHLYDSKEQYVAVDHWLTGGNFKFNESFSHWNSLSAHVVMAPPLSILPSERIGLTSQTLEVLVHEAAHLGTYTVVPTYRYHPTWFSEGLAMHIEQTTLRKLGLLQAAADHPRYAKQQLVAKSLLDQGRVPNVLDLLLDELGDLNFHERYALWNEFMTVLTSSPTKFEALVRELRSMGGGPRIRARMSTAVIDGYGAAFLERELRRTLAHAPALWDETARSLETIGEAWEQVAFDSVDARAWKLGPRAAGDYRIEGSLEWLASGTGMQVLIDRQLESFLIVEFEKGRLRLKLQGAQGGELIASAELPVVPSKPGLSFGIQVQGQVLSVEVDGVQVLRMTPRGRSLEGAWGLGVARGGAGIWQGVRLLQPAKEPGGQPGTEEK